MNRNARELKELRALRPDGVKVVGITGGIASGKTVATRALAQHGYTVIDADEISRELSAQGSELNAAIKAAFPECVRADALDRKALRALISTSLEAKHRLNSITHPAITAETERRLKNAARPAVLSAPLLFECALARLCDCVVCVTCPKDIKISRITARDGISESDAAKIIDAQISDSSRVALSDFIVPSDIPQAEFEKEIIELFDSLTK